MTREICKSCGRINPVGFTVPPGVWVDVVGFDYNETLCILCFAQRADDAGVPWDRDIQFHPVSLVTHRDQPSRTVEVRTGALAGRTQILKFQIDSTFCKECKTHFGYHSLDCPHARAMYSGLREQKTL